MTKKIIITFALTLSFLSFGASYAHAAPGDQFQFQPIVAIPLPTGQVNSDTTIAEYLNAVFRLTIAIATILAIVMITFDGFRYMTSDVIGKKSEAIERLRGAFLGLFILLASYIIFSVINPNMLNLDAFTKDLSTLSGAGVPTTPATGSSAGGSGTALTPGALPTGTELRPYSGTVTPGCELKCQASDGTVRTPTRNGCIPNVQQCPR